MCHRCNYFTLNFLDINSYKILHRYLLIFRNISFYNNILNYIISFYSADWYKGQLTDAELDALENPPTPKPKPAGSSSRRKPNRPSKGKQVDVEIVEE